MGNENAALASALENLRRVVEKVQAETAESDSLLVQQSGLPQQWPEGFFAATEGAFADEPFERPPQGELPQREEW
jgi:hypothetical protein